MKQTMQQIMIANLMLLYCCTVFSPPVRVAYAAGDTAEAELFANWITALAESAAPELRPANRRGGSAPSVTVATDEIERFFHQLRGNLNLRPAKSAKDQKSLYCPAAWPETVGTPVMLPVMLPIPHVYRGSNQALPQASIYFLQPVRAGPDRCFA